MKASMHAISFLHPTLVDINQLRFKLYNPTIPQLHQSIHQSQLMIL
jgi:hypothetical protein